MINTVIFSKDRACQLDMLIRSMEKHAKELQPSVLYRTTSQRFNQGYAKIPQCDTVRVVAERNFRADVIRLCTVSDPYTMFLSDDDVFVRDMPVFAGLEPDELCVSLRLAPKLTFCHPTQREQVPPKITGLRYDWADADGDYGYPMSLNGHIFRTEELLAKLESAEFICPNTLEVALAASPIRRPKIRCMAKSVVVNVPVNQVQNRWRLPNMGLDATIINELWLCGMSMSVSYSKNISCHAEIPISFT